ncbi:MAG: hypothetical protein WCK35_28940 [Chloroflexota bacterium]
MSMSMPEPLPVEPKKNRTPMIIAIVLAVLCCCCLIGGLAGYWLWQNGDSLVGTSVLLNALSVL